MYEQAQLEVRSDLRSAHEQVWQKIAQPGPFFSAEDRVAMVLEARQSLLCTLCNKRKEALSPNAVAGEHDSVSQLAPVLVDLIHRIRTDPARFTKTVFDTVTETHAKEEYVEIVSVVATSVIVDTFHRAIGLPVPRTLHPSNGTPHGQAEPRVVDEGAWVPLSSQEIQHPELGFRRAPNIMRSMGCVPEAVALFFTCFRNHYSMMGVPMALTQPQVEFIAARVSALNQCFY